MTSSTAADCVDASLTFGARNVMALNARAGIVSGCRRRVNVDSSDGAWIDPVGIAGSYFYTGLSNSGGQYATVPAGGLGQWNDDGLDSATPVVPSDPSLNLVLCGTVEYTCQVRVDANWVPSRETTVRARVGVSFDTTGRVFNGVGTSRQMPTDGTFMGVSATVPFVVTIPAGSAVRPLFGSWSGLDLTSWVPQSGVSASMPVAAYRQLTIAGALYPLRGLEDCSQ